MVSERLRFSAQKPRGDRRSSSGILAGCPQNDTFSQIAVSRKLKSATCETTAPAAEGAATLGGTFAAAEFERVSFRIAPIEKDIFGGVGNFRERMQALDNRFVGRPRYPGAQARAARPRTVRLRAAPRSTR